MCLIQETHDFDVYDYDILNTMRIKFLSQKQKEGKYAQPFPMASGFPSSVSTEKTTLFIFSRDNRLHGTLVCTGTTIRAKFGIDNVLIFSFADRLDRTFILTGTTSNTFICNYIRHVIFLLVMFIFTSLLKTLRAGWIDTPTFKIEQCKICGWFLGRLHCYTATTSLTSGISFCKNF